MHKVLEGQLNAKGKKFGIVVGRFNDFVTSKLLEGSMDCLRRHQGEMDKVTVAWVPGAFEIPLMAKKLAKTRGFDAIICLGAVIRGSTAHFDYVAGEAAKGVGAVALEFDLPVIFGVLTTDTLEQAIERAGSKAGNKGWEAALTAIEMADLSQKIQY